MVHIYPFIGYPATYCDPAVVNFIATPAIAELGSSVPNVVLRWELSKTPLTLKLGSTVLPPNTGLTTVDGPFTTNQSWTLSFADEEKSVSGKATLQFQNKVYWDNVVAEPTSSAGILAMANAFFATKFQRTMQFGSPNGKKPCLAYPTRFGLPKRVYIGTPGVSIAIPVVWTLFTDFTVTTVAFTNASGYAETYNVVTFDAVRSDSSLLIAWDSYVAVKPEPV